MSEGFGSSDLFSQAPRYVKDYTPKGVVDRLFEKEGEPYACFTKEELVELQAEILTNFAESIKNYTILGGYDEDGTPQPAQLGGAYIDGNGPLDKILDRVLKKALEGKNES